MYNFGASLFMTFLFFAIMILFIPVIIHEITITSKSDDPKYDSPFRAGFICPVIAFALAFALFIANIPQPATMILEDGTRVDFKAKEYRVDVSEYNNSKIFKGEKDDMTYKLEFSSADIPKAENIVEYLLKQDSDIYALKYNGHTYVVLEDRVEIK